MAGFVPAIHDFAGFSTASRGWPGQALPDAHICGTIEQYTLISMDYGRPGVDTLASL
jgi:hypothetical protein